MALDVPIVEFLSLLGHDGSEIIRPSLPDPISRRGVHIQEAIDVAWSLGFSVTPFELAPVGVRSLAGTDEPFIVQFPGATGNWGRFIRHINEGKGVIECTGRRSGHAVAFEKGRIYDPDDTVFDYSQAACELRGLMTVRLWRFERRK